MDLTSDQVARLKLAADAAKGFVAPQGLLVAQWALESGWGLHQPGNNCFGIKAYLGGSSQLLHTTEWFTETGVHVFLDAKVGRTAVLITPVRTDGEGRHEYAVQDWFATFPTLAACFAKRASLFAAGPYAPFYHQYAIDRDLIAYIRNIGPVYATAPDYADQVISILRMPEVSSVLS